MTPMEKKPYSIPFSVSSALNTLRSAGFQAYPVGGCVRDLLLNREIHDWDLTTSASPDQIKQAFSQYPVVETGISHGTVTVCFPEMPLEITTYREDGEYKDHRHPDKVIFTQELGKDLARRDFTINAMALGESSQIIDFFQGADDLKKRQIRCVGSPDARFEEDGLRILRALRFASVLNFSIEKETERSLYEKKELLLTISPERIWSEFQKLLCGDAAVTVLRKYHSIFSVIFPEIKELKDFPQHNPYHCYDIWEHTLHALEHSPADFPLRCALLFHDSGKPEVFTRDSLGVGHFYGHEKVSLRKVRAVLSRFRSDKKTENLVSFLVEKHGIPLFPDPVLLKKRLRAFGPDKLQCLFEIQKADSSALALWEEKLIPLKQAEEMLRDILQEEHCFSIKDLAVSGRDLLPFLPEGPEIGKCLQELLSGVIEGLYPNQKEALLAIVQEKYTQKRNTGSLPE